MSSSISPTNDQKYVLTRLQRLCNSWLMREYYPQFKYDYILRMF